MKDKLLRLLSDEIQAAPSEDVMKNPNAAIKITPHSVTRNYGELADKILALMPSQNPLVTHTQPTTYNFEDEPTKTSY